MWTRKMWYVLRESVFMLFAIVTQYVLCMYVYVHAYVYIMVLVYVYV